MVKGFKNTEVGIIPEDWTTPCIKDFSDLLSGGTPSTKINEYWEGNIRWMNSGELNLKRVYEVEGRITELGLKNLSTKLIPSNCVLIGLAGQGKTRGTVALNYTPLCTNQSIASILPNKEVLSEYIYQNLDLRYYELRGLSPGDGGIGGLNLTIIRNLKIPLPPTKAEQTAIATALNDVDELITQLEKLIAKKKAIKQGAMQELLKPKEDWKTKLLGEIVGFYSGKAHEQCIDENGSYIVVNSKFVSTEGAIAKYSNQNISPLFKGDITIVMSDIPNGKALAKCFLIDKNDKYTLNQRIGSIRPIEGDSRYYFYQLNRNRYFLTFDSGSGQTNLRENDILDFPFPLPPTLSEQSRIAEILSDMEYEILRLEDRLEKQKQFKQGMMQSLFTGKIRLV